MGECVRPSDGVVFDLDYLMLAAKEAEQAFHIADFGYGVLFGMFFVMWSWMMVRLIVGVKHGNNPA